MRYALKDGGTTSVDGERRYTMRGSVILLAMSALLWGSAAGAAAPRIEVDAMTHDFGEVAEGTAVRHTFVLRNAGDGILSIQRVFAACGCTTTALKKRELAAGESVPLEATLDTAGFRGALTKTISIRSNDPTTPDITLRMTATVVPRPAHQWPVGDLRSGMLVMIDVRSPETYAAGHLIGALNVPIEELPARALGIPGDLFLVVYDADGSRVEEAVSILRTRGVRDAWGLRGGLDAWRTAFPNRYEIAGAPAGAEQFISPMGASTPAVTSAASHSLVTVHDLFRWFYALVDLRSPEAYASGHIAGAVSIPAAGVGEASKWLPQNAAIVFYDEDAAGSDSTARRFIDAGFSRAKSLLGGLDEWRRQYGDLFLVQVVE